MTVLEKTDYDTDSYLMDFSDKVPAGITLKSSPDPTVEWLLFDGSAPVSGAPSAEAGTFILDGATSLIWQFDVSGGTLGVNYIVRVKAVRNDNLPVEGNGILIVRLPPKPLS